MQNTVEWTDTTLWLSTLLHLHLLRLYSHIHSSGSILSPFSKAILRSVHVTEHRGICQRCLLQKARGWSDSGEKPLGNLTGECSRSLSEGTYF